MNPNIGLSGEFVIRTKSQKVQLFKPGAGFPQGAVVPGPANVLYRIKNLGPGDMKMTATAAAGQPASVSYIYAGCTMDVPYYHNIQTGVILTTEDAPSLEVPFAYSVPAPR
ncbi:MAG: hypothetical protein HOP28_05855 [Gemmatimonadales bacterium]|nr:hypothetical protein [Gemmatimonadales bacterium]